MKNSPARIHLIFPTRSFEKIHMSQSIQTNDEIDRAVLSLISTNPLDFLTRLENPDEFSDRLFHLSQLISSKPSQSSMWYWFLETDFNETIVKHFSSIDYAYCIHFFWQPDHKDSCHQLQKMCQLNPNLLADLIQCEKNFEKSTNAIDVIIRNGLVDLTRQYTSNTDGSQCSLLQLAIDCNRSIVAGKLIDVIDYTENEAHEMLKRIIDKNSKTIDDDMEMIGLVFLNASNLSQKQISDLWFKINWKTCRHEKLYPAINQYFKKLNAQMEIIFEYFNFVDFIRQAKIQTKSQRATRTFMDRVERFIQKYPMVENDAFAHKCLCFQNAMTYFCVRDRFLKNCQNYSLSKIQEICEKIDQHFAFLERNKLKPGFSNFLLYKCSCFNPYQAGLMNFSSHISIIDVSLN